MIKTLKKYFTFLYILLALTIGLILFLLLDTHHPDKISIAVGRETGAYNEYAKLYKKIFKEKYNIELKIIYSEGSQHAQERVLNEEADFAIAQSSTEIYQEENGLLALANIAYEPIWIFYKDQNITNFQDLQHTKNNIEKPKSGTHTVAQLLLKQINAKREQNEHNTSYAFELLKKNQLDTLFLTIGIRSKILNTIFNEPNIKIVNFKEAQAYKSFFLKESELSKYNFNTTNYFEVITLKKHALNIANNLPSKDITLLTTQTLLVTKNSSNEMSRLLLKIANEVHSKAGILNQQYHFPNNSMFKLKQHEASIEYFKEKEHRYERYNLFNSFWLAQSLKKLENFILLFIIPIGLIGFFIEVIHPASKMISRREINKWYKQVNKSDTNIEALNLEELEKRRDQLEDILVEIQNRDDLDPIHLEAYYSLQNQITNILENFDKRIEKKESQKIYVEVE